MGKLEAEGFQALITIAGAFLAGCVFTNVVNEQQQAERRKAYEQGYDEGYSDGKHEKSVSDFVKQTLGM